MKRYATVPAGEYMVPLIGIPASATQERCVKCKKLVHLTEINLDGICKKCAKKKL